MSENVKKMKRNRWTIYSLGLAAVLFVAYTIVSFVLFNNQAHHDHFDKFQWFMSDIDAYLEEMQGIDSGFDFPYPIFFMLGRFFMLFTDVGTAAAIATVVLNSVSVVAMLYFFDRVTRLFWLDADGNQATGAKADQTRQFLVVVLSFGILMVSMLYAPKGVYLPGMDHKYLGVFSPNPWHNHTYLATRGFAIVAFFLLAEILEYYEKKVDVKQYVLFSIFLLLTTLAKPSFTLVLGSTMVVLMLVRLIAHKGQTWKQTLYLGLCFIPTILDLLYQFGGVFGSRGHAGEDGGIGFGIGAAWSQYTHNIPLAIMLAFAFPGFVLLLNLKYLLTDVRFRFSWELALTSLLEFLFLFEKGDRFVHTNFSWGYMHGIFFAFVGSSLLLLENTRKKRQPIWVLALEWALFVWHVLAGFRFFEYMFSGQFYYSF